MPNKHKTVWKRRHVKERLPVHTEACNALLDPLRLQVRPLNTEPRKSKFWWDRGKGLEAACEQTRLTAPRWGQKSQAWHPEHWRKGEDTKGRPQANPRHASPPSVSPRLLRVKFLPVGSAPAGCGAHNPMFYVLSGRTGVFSPSVEHYSSHILLSATLLKFR